LAREHVSGARRTKNLETHRPSALNTYGLEFSKWTCQFTTSAVSPTVVQAISFDDEVHASLVLTGLCCISNAQKRLMSKCR